MIETESQLDELTAPLQRVAVKNASEPAYEVTLLDILTQLALRKRLIAGVGGLAAVVGLVVSLLLPVRYAATTRIMPPQQTQSTAAMMMNQLSGSGVGSQAMLSGGGLGLRNPNDIYVSLLTSRPVADGVIQRFSLTSVYHSKDMTAARKRLAGNTAVAAEKSGLISISVNDRDKKRAAAMANAYVEQLRTLTKNLAVTEASQRLLFYQEQLKDARESLVAAETGFQQVQQNKGLVALDAQAKAAIESLTAIRALVAAKQVQVQALQSYSTEHNPDLALAERELESLRAQAARLEQRNHLPGSSSLGLGDMPEAGLDYLRAEHEVKYRQALFDLLLKQYDAAKLDESKEAAIIQVVEPAIEPDRRTSPKRTLIVLICAGFGFFAGCVLALILWWTECLQSDQKFGEQLRELRCALGQ